MDEPQVSSISRRDLLKLGGAAIAAGSGLPLLDPKRATAQTPKRGGTFRLRIHVAPVHFDPQRRRPLPASADRDGLSMRPVARPCAFLLVRAGHVCGRPCLS